MNFKNSVVLLISLIYFFVFSVSFLTFAQTDTLALIGNVPITSSDFQNRFELSVYPGKGLESNLHLEKEGFLYSMIAEKLLSNSYTGSLNNKSKDENQLKEEIESMFLRDALYRKEVLSKVKVSDAELKKGLSCSVYTYILDTFYMPDSASALEFYSKAVMHGGSIYKLTDSLKVSHDTLAIGYGESNETIENAVFNHDTGFISKPTNTVDGWVIFKIVGKVINKDFASYAANDKIEKVKTIIKRRKEDKLGYDYLLSVMKGVEVNVNYKIFRAFVYFVKNILASHRLSSFEHNYYLSENEIQYIRDKFPYDPKADFLKFKNGGLTLGYVLDNLSTSGFAPKDTSLPEITVALHSALKFIAQNFFIAKRAREMNLQNSGEVRYNVKTFLDAFRASELSKDVLDTVKISRRQLDDFFEKHKDVVLNDVRLRLQIFTLDNIDEAAGILNKLSSLENSTGDTAGAMWFNASQLGEIGAVLAELPDGRIYGPLFNDNKYVIYRILDKQSKISKTKIENSIEVASDLYSRQRKSEVLSKYIADLAEKQKVKIFINKLDKISVTPIQMLTFRYIGFGGKVAAVPPLYPREEWIKYFNSQNQLP
jgi:hypothetical protein